MFRAILTTIVSAVAIVIAMSAYGGDPGNTPTTPAADSPAADRPAADKDKTDGDKGKDKAADKDKADADKGKDKADDKDKADADKGKDKAGEKSQPDGAGDNSQLQAVQPYSFGGSDDDADITTILNQSTYWSGVYPEYFRHHPHAEYRRDREARDPEYRRDREAREREAREAHQHPSNEPRGYSRANERHERWNGKSPQAARAEERAYAGTQHQAQAQRANTNPAPRSATQVPRPNPPAGRLPPR